MFGKLSENYEKFKRYVIWLYSLYELNTQISICEPWEKVFCNVLLGSCLSLVTYATYAYVPGYCLMLVGFLVPVALTKNNSNITVKCAEAAEGLCPSSIKSYLT
ncbi:serine palmitoyltransferase small subunit B [Drosophila grimshawi]|uniref:Serine palmitoyltransferase small subunit B n=1 Tax=Drosophila grimshawi TaxID=7222 RepID=B4J6D0_DROGR|nr:serine palmitoyltransferase small subunit B [Drosophila grimshawi]EDW00903.1 GH20759 [Drosophila grimshawi]